MKCAIVMVLVPMVLVSVSSTWAQQVERASSPAAIRGKLPVKVGGRVFFVVPVAELPGPLQEQLKGKVALAVVDEQGRLLKDRAVIFKGLLAYHVARTLLDDPTEGGWDVGQAENWAKSFEARAEVLRRIRIQQGVADLLTEGGYLGARFLVIGGLAGVLEGIGVTVDVPKAALEAFIWQAIANPKNVARMLLSGDLVSAERRLMDGAQLLRSVRGYPLDSDVALKLFEIDVVDAPLGSEAALTRLAIAGSIPQQLWEPIKVTLEQAEHLLRKVAEPNVALAGELVSVAGKLVSLVRQVEGWNAYENERRKILDNWKELLHGYSEMADAIATIAEQQEGIQRRTATGGLSTAREIELTKIATIVKVRGPMSFSPDSQLLAIVGDLPPEAAPRPHTDVIQIWRFPGCKLDKILVPPQELLTSRRNIASIAFSPDGRLLAVGWEEGLVDLWDVAEGRWREETLDLPFRTILGNTVPREIVSVAFSPDGRSVIIATATEIWVWNLETGKARVAFPLLPGAPRKLACFPKGAIVGAVSVGAAGKGWVMVWDWATGVVGRSVGPLGGTRFMPAYALAFSPDGRTLATGSRTPSDAYGAILLWDVQALLAGRVEYRYFVPDDIGVKVSDLAYFPNEDILAIAAGDRGFYTRVPGKITKWKDLKEAWHVAISPDGRLMAVIGSSVAVVYEVKRK